MSPLPSPSDPELPSTDEAIRRTLVAVAACGVMLVVGALLWSGAKAAGSVAVGVGLAALNLYALSKAVVALLGGGTRAAGWAVLGMLKQGALFGGAWLMFRSGFVEALPFVVGYCALPLGIPLGTIFAGGAVPPATTSPSSPGAEGTPAGE